MNTEEERERDKKDVGRNVYRWNGMVEGRQVTLVMIPLAELMQCVSLHLRWC